MLPLFSCHNNFEENENQSNGEGKCVTSHFLLLITHYNVIVSSEINKFHFLPFIFQCYY